MIDRSLRNRLLKELECMNEALNEFRNKKTTDERRLVIWEELSARTWASIYLAQYEGEADRPEDYDSVVGEAYLYDGMDYSEVSGVSIQ